MVPLVANGPPKPASQQWVETVQNILLDIGWPGGLGELLLLILGVSFFLLQLKTFIKRAFFSESGIRAKGRVIEVGEAFNRLALAKIAYRVADGRVFHIADRGPYGPGDAGRQVTVLYADLNPQRAYVYRPSGAAARQFLVGGAAAVACAIYGFMPVLTAVPG